jgi:hypothetical protein
MDVYLFDGDVCAAMQWICSRSAVEDVDNERLLVTGVYNHAGDVYKLSVDTICATESATDSGVNVHIFSADNGGLAGGDNGIG